MRKSISEIFGQSPAKNHTAAVAGLVFKTQKPDPSGHTAPTVRFDSKKNAKKAFLVRYFFQNTSV